MIRTRTIHIIDITLDILITISQRLAISIKHIQIPGDNSYCTRPVQSVIRTIPPASGWYNIGKYPVGLLLIPMVGQPFFISGNPIEIIQRCFDRKMTVTRPSVLFALRTIGRVSHQIRQISIVGSPPQFIYQLTRCPDLSGSRHIAVHKESGQAVLV